MKHCIALLVWLLATNCFAKNFNDRDCNDVSKVEKASFVLFNKTKLVEFGECLGVSLIKQNDTSWIPEACAEIPEDENAPLGILNLSKKEAIQIGMCLGLVEYIYHKYHDEYSGYNRLQCLDGTRAINKLLTMSNDDIASLANIRDQLCH